MKIKVFTLILVSVLLTSCDCWIEVNGKIISSNTEKPIGGARIEMVDKNIFTESDEYGNFSIGEMTGTCYSPEIKVSYNNHKPFQIELESESGYQNFKLKRESESVEFEEPVYPDPKNKNTFILSTWIEKYSQDFEIKSDTIIIYLNEQNLEKEIQLIKDKLKNKNSG